MNSMHSRCSTFRNSTRGNRRRKAGPSHDTDMSTPRYIPVANFTPNTNHTMKAFPLRESDEGKNRSLNCRKEMLEIKYPTVKKSSDEITE